MVKAPEPVEELDYEKALAELESILGSLENETRELAATMDLYERGRALVKRCQNLLDQAELKVKILDENGQLSDLEGES